jgi:hypothetical protein
LTSFLALVRGKGRRGDEEEASTSAVFPSLDSSPPDDRDEPTENNADLPSFTLTDTGYISGVKEMPYWVDKFGSLNSATGEMEITSGRDSLVTSILSAGTFCGALLSYPLGDHLGRRYGASVVPSFSFRKH